MSSRKLRSSTNAVLSELIQKKGKLEKLRLHLVAELERVDDSLTQIQAEYVKTLNDISPLLNLPTEVTCMIFDLAVASRSVEESDFKKKSLLREVVISHVCKKWRDVSLSYPRMWTSFFFLAKNVKYMRNSINRFDLYIKRSNSQNLDLFIDFREDYHSAQLTRAEAEQSEMIDMAIRVVERWKTMTFYSEIHQRIEEYFVLRSITTSAPNLEYFKYSPKSRIRFLATAQASPMQSNSIDSLNTLFQGGAPKLHYLFLKFSTFKMPPCSNITTLRLEVGDEGMTETCYPWNIFLEILSIPSLANLSIVGNIFWVPRDHDGISTIPLNNLKHFRFSNVDYGMTFLLPLFRAPLLETLTIRDDMGWENELQTNPSGLTEHDYFFPSLHTLTLIDIFASSSDSAWRFVNLTKNISSLLISHDNPYNNFFVAIQKHGPFDNHCWPNLTTMMARINNWEEIDVISNFVRSRPKKSLKMLVFEETHRSWKANFPKQFARIKENCNFEVLTSGEEAETAFMRSMWPPGVDCPDYAFRKDPFEIYYY